MSNDAMTTEQAHRLVALRKLIRDTAATEDADGWSVDIDDETSERIALAVLAYAGTGEVTTEWGIRWAEVDEVEQEKGSEVYARGVVQLYPGDAGLVSREVRRGPWIAVTS